MYRYKDMQYIVYFSSVEFIVILVNLIKKKIDSFMISLRFYLVHISITSKQCRCMSLLITTFIHSLHVALSVSGCSSWNTAKVCILRWHFHNHNFDKSKKSTCFSFRLQTNIDVIRLQFSTFTKWILFCLRAMPRANGTVWFNLSTILMF